MNAKIIVTGTRVDILSTNGTGRVTGHGQIIGVLAGGLYIVERANGRRIGINGSLLRAAA